MQCQTFCAKTRRIANLDVKTISEHFKTCFSVVAWNPVAKLKTFE